MEFAVKNRKKRSNWNPIKWVVDVIDFIFDVLD
ncbi:hypothetical protein [Citrobacter phage Tr1]|nr:hypothetical protein [Citrobacter phage Tr1]